MVAPSSVIACCRLVLGLALLFVSTSSGFTVPLLTTRPTASSAQPKTLLLKAEKNNDDDNDGDTKRVGIVTKASWYAAEAFGKVFGRRKRAEGDEDEDEGNGNGNEEAAVAIETYDLSKPPSSLQETVARLKQDNEREYFLSGQVDRLIYDPDCEFADPFVSFKGRDRFVENLANLGSFITQYSAKPLQNKKKQQQQQAETEDGQQVTTTTVETKFMVKLELGLPWKPVLAWPWGVRCEIDPDTNLVVLHKESWDIEPWEGVSQVFRKPTTTVK